jgi:hypothetical protein
MKRYWAMKTYLKWWDTFQDGEIIGIDQNGIDKNFSNYSDEEIEKLLSKGLTESIERNFKQFCSYMNPGDYVIIGTGQQTKFNISGICKVEGEYIFDENYYPRHIRKVKFVKFFKNAIPLQRFARVARLELIDEIDFQEAIISLLK